MRRHIQLLLVLATTALLLPERTLAQETAVAAAPADVASIDAIVAALYDVISGPAGEKRDWDRFHSLFVPGARLIPSGPRREGGFGHRVQTPADYQNVSGKILEERGFFEREIGRRTDRFGNIAHVFSAYDSRWKESDPEPFARGINSIQLFWDGTRWWVVSVYWTGETPESPIPAEYLGS